MRLLEDFLLMIISEIGIWILRMEYLNSYDSTLRIDAHNILAVERKKYIGSKSIQKFGIFCCEKIQKEINYYGEKQKLVSLLVSAFISLKVSIPSYFHILREMIYILNFIFCSSKINCFIFQHQYLRILLNSKQPLLIKDNSLFIMRI